MKKYVYVVQGASRFPLDMLRYDGAHPTTMSSVESMSDALALNFPLSTKELTVQMASEKKPTVERWKTFGWLVISCTGLKEGEPTWVSIKEDVDGMYKQMSKRPICQICKTRGAEYERLVPMQRAGSYMCGTCWEAESRAQLGTTSSIGKKLVIVSPGERSWQGNVYWKDAMAMVAVGQVKIGLTGPPKARRYELLSEGRPIGAVFWHGDESKTATNSLDEVVNNVRKGGDENG